MPIYGLTDVEAKFPRLGKIRKGAQKEEGKPGKDLEYFRLATEDENIEKKWLDLFGEQPSELSIRLLYPQREQNFSCYLEEWTNSSLRRRCDGVNQNLWLTKSLQYSTEVIPCIKPDCTCNPIGRMQLSIPGIERVGYFELITSSRWDIVTLNENLLAIENSLGRVNGLPLLLKRQPRQISAIYQGKRHKTIKSLLSIEIHPDSFNQLINQLNNPQPEMLSSGGSIDG